MIVKVHKGSSTPGANNKGSASKLVDYLEKENNSLENGGYFFGRTNDKDKFQEDITRTQATIAIDNNTKGLRKTDTKFFMLTVNLSSKEQKHITSKIAGREINSVDELSKKEKKVYEKKLRDYTKGVMDIYAKNFKRGLTEKDMIYVCKTEHERTYKGYEKEVEEGHKKSGDKKEGFQTHIHIVVSRQDASQSVMLSPNAKERIAKDNHQVNGKKITKGFNHETFKLKTELLFDKQFAYNRKYQESYSSKSNNQALKSITKAYKNQLTPAEYKEMSALSDQNINMVIKYFTKPNEAILQKLNNNIRSQLSLKAKVADQMMNTL